MDDMISDILGLWLEAGMSFDNYDDYTVAEMMFVVDAYLNKEKRHRKIATGDLFWLVTNMAAAIHDPKKLPRNLSDAFPDLHEEESSEEAMQRRFLEGVQQHNRNRR